MKHLATYLTNIVTGLPLFTERLIDCQILPPQSRDHSPWHVSMGNPGNDLLQVRDTQRPGEAKYRCLFNTFSLFYSDSCIHPHRTKLQACRVHFLLIKLCQNQQIKTEVIITRSEDTIGICLSQIRKYRGIGRKTWIRK